MLYGLCLSSVDCFSTMWRKLLGKLFTLKERKKRSQSYQKKNAKELVDIIRQGIRTVKVYIYQLSCESAQPTEIHGCRVIDLTIVRKK